MIRLIPVFAIAFFLLAAAALAERHGGRASGDGSNLAADVADRASGADHTAAIDDLHDQINNAQGMDENDKAHLHQMADTVKGAMDQVRDGSVHIDALQAQKLVTVDHAERAKIEADLKLHGDRVATGRGTLAQVRRQLESEVAALPDLTPTQKHQVDAVLRDLADNRITGAQAKAAVQGMCGARCENRIQLIVMIATNIFGQNGLPP